MLSSFRLLLFFFAFVYGFVVDVLMLPVDVACFFASATFHANRCNPQKSLLLVSFRFRFFVAHLLLSNCIHRIGFVLFLRFIHHSIKRLC